MQLVLDTSVLVAGLRSSQGASYALLELVGTPKVMLNVSVPLVLEYEATLKEQSRAIGLTAAEIDDVIDYLCSVATKREIFYLWRPALRDPLDDMVLELAVSAEADVVTHNLRDFEGAAKYGVNVYSPGELLRVLRK